MNINSEPMLGLIQVHPMLAEPAGVALLPLLVLALLFFALVVGAVIALILVLSRRTGKSAAPPIFPESTPPTQPPLAQSTKVISKKCPQCGAALQSDTAEGLCPACLLKQGIPTEPGGEQKQNTFVPPEVAELAAKFPQLEILELIGRGGMGAVYKARQRQLDRIVALKILPPGIGHDPAFSERFAREAKALARLNHPGIVTIHDFGRADGLYYFLMEYVDGATLRQLLNAGRVAPREALAIVPQICDALQFAHDQGIVHRDIKPENVLLDRRGRVKVADFGLAKLVGVESEPAAALSAAGSPALTESGKIMGTPNYMAPEQLENPGEVDHRADIYALGVVFYQMLTGELPGKKIEPPSSKVEVDVRLDEVVLRALEKNPERRYSQASILKTRVETIAQTPPVATPAEVAAFTQAAMTRDYQLDISFCLSRAWNLLKSDFWPIVGVAALIGLVQHAANSTLVGIILGGPLAGGLWLYFLKKIRGEQAVVGTAFSGFNVAFAQLLIAHVVTSLLMAVGFLCLVLPGIYFAVAWAFTLILVADKGLEFWPAMGLSRQVVSKHWWKFFWFLIVLGLINVAGWLACFIGIFVTLPITLAALAYAYEDIFGPAAKAAGAGVGNAPVRSGREQSSGIGLALVAGAAAISLVVLGVAAAIAIPNLNRAKHRAQNMRLEMRLEQERLKEEILRRKAATGPKIQWVNTQGPNVFVEGFATEKSRLALLIGQQEGWSCGFTEPTLFTSSLGRLGNGLSWSVKGNDGRLNLLDVSAWDHLGAVDFSQGTIAFKEDSAQPRLDEYFIIGQFKPLNGGEPIPIALRFDADATATSASAETWAPFLSTNQLLQLAKILEDAKKFADEGRYEEALGRHIWFHKHGPEFGDSYQDVVRITSALSQWEELGRRYPKAKQALIEIRDAAARQITEGHGYAALVRDVQAINHELQEEDATYELFKTIREKDPKLAGQSYFYLEELLVAKREYQWCYDHMGDAQTRFGSIQRTFEMERENQKRMAEIRAQTMRQTAAINQRYGRTNTFSPPDTSAVIEQSANDRFVSSVRRLLEILVGTNHRADAEKIRNQALAVLDDPRLKSAVEDAEQAATKNLDVHAEK